MVRWALLVGLVIGVGTMASTQTVPSDVFVLEIPELDIRLASNGAAALPNAALAAFRIRIRNLSTISGYGGIYARVNGETANSVMTTRSLADGVVCDFDIRRREALRMRPGRNTVEITVEDARRRLHYASFLLDTPARTAVPDVRPSTGTIEPTTGARLAMVVGIARYQASARGLVNLAFADKDAIAFQEFLLSPAGGFSPEHVRLLVNEDATLDAVKAALSWLARSATAADEVVVYLAGHGTPDPKDPRKLYMLTHDSDLERLSASAFSMTDFDDLYARSLRVGRIVTFADICRVGPSPGPGGTGVLNLVHQYLSRSAAGDRRGGVVASDAGEVACEGPEFGGGHGAFTHFLLAGLRGAADTNRDGTVTLAEAAGYVTEHVGRATSGRQTPRPIGENGGWWPMAGLGARRRVR